jgi:hydroxypyruvate reductase
VSARVGRLHDRAALTRAGNGGKRALALDLFEVALDAVDARTATEAALDRARDDGLDLEGAVVIGLGKAARGMAEAAVARARPSRGIVVCFEDGSLGPLVLRAAEHPISGATAIDNGQALVELARGVRPDETVLCLVSGGGSAMVELPVAGVDAGVLEAVTRALLASGAPIEVMNAIRARLSRIKGGGLARALSGARIVNIVISDVPGSPPSVVASGPTLAPLVGAVDLRRMLDTHGLRQRLPREALAVLEAANDEPARGARPHGEIHTYVAADNESARRAAASHARALGLSVAERPGFSRGEAREVGARFYDDARASGADVVVWGGEPTVLVAGTGRGGRNEELVLGALSRYADGLLASFATDGIDGTSEAAGAILDEGVVERAREEGLEAAASLANNDADTFFERTKGRVVTGLTGTNVADLTLFVAEAGGRFSRAIR